jgi:hypothetical protein
LEKELITALLLGIGLSASCGFRVFAPMLVASVAVRAGFLPINENFEWLASGAAIVCFGVATIVEIIAYYIPFVDNLLDTVSTPLAIAAGTLLTASVLPVEADMLRWVLGFIVGGGAASVFQGASSISRLGSSSLTAGLGNPVVSSGENVVSLGLPLLVIAFPLLIGGLVLLVLFWFLKKLLFRKQRR